MESNNTVLGAVILVLMVVGVNLIMYALVRAAARSNKTDKGFWETINKSLNTSTRAKDDPLGELRHRIEELEKGKKEDTGDS